MKIVKHRELYLTGYDVADNKRRRRLRDLLRGFASGGQKSVYECFLTPQEVEHILREATATINHAEDRLFVVRLGPDPHIVPLGRAVAPRNPPFFYMG